MKTAKKFNTRAFVALTIALSGLGLVLTGIFNHYYGFSPMTVERHSWMSAHNGLGLLFVVFSIWHAVINRRSFWKHITRSVSRAPSIGREMVLAGLVLTLSLLVCVGHVFIIG